MLVERDLPLTVAWLVEQAMAPFPAASAAAREQLVTYVFERLAGYLRDLGYSTLEVEAAIAAKPPWGEFPARLAAIHAFAQLPEAANLAAANKRIGNILKKSTEQNGKVDASRLVEPAERDLHVACLAATPVFEKHFHARDYTAALRSLATLKTPVDAFFEHVMVNAEDAGLRANRLALLSDLHAMMNRVADLSKLAA
jgi:glycyl-tRNA synthetase beta chain